MAAALLYGMRCAVCGVRYAVCIGQTPLCYMSGGSNLVTDATLEVVELLLEYVRVRLVVGRFSRDASASVHWCTPDSFVNVAGTYVCLLSVSRPRCPCVHRFCADTTPTEHTKCPVRSSCVV